MTFQPGFLVSIVVILLASRLAGEAAQRMGQPPVLGQLIAGILPGPTLLGAVAPHLEEAIFPPDPAQKAALAAFAEFGILLLLVLTGMETDLRLMQKIGWLALSIPLSGVAIPFACGVALGLMLPSSLAPNDERRLATALFLGVALSISSIKIVASVVRDMDFERRDLGQIMVASSVVEDSLGWIIIAAILGIVRNGAVDVGRVAWTVGGLALFLAVSLTAGRRLIVNAIRVVNDVFLGESMTLTLILLVMGALALFTQTLGVQTVLGALIAGILIGESPILTKTIGGQLRAMVAALFAPVFFALAGLNARPAPCSREQASGGRGERNHRDRRSAQPGDPGQEPLVGQLAAGDPLRSRNGGGDADRPRRRHPPIRRDAVRRNRQPYAGDEPLLAPVRRELVISSRTQPRPHRPGSG